MCLFITTAIFTGSECFLWVLNVGNTVILTGLTYPSSRNVFHDILTKSGAKKSIMGRSSVGLFICSFGVLRRFQHCTGHITTGSWKGRGNQYIQFARVVYCKLPTNGKQLPAFPLKAMTGIEPRPQRWEARVLPLCHRGPRSLVGKMDE